MHLCSLGLRPNCKDRISLKQTKVPQITNAPASEHVIIAWDTRLIIEKREFIARSLCKQSAVQIRRRILQNRICPEVKHTRPAMKVA
jgi:hypothetical protein